MAETTEKRPGGEGLTGYVVTLWIVGGLSLSAVLLAAGLFVVVGHDIGWKLSESPSEYMDFGVFVGALITPLVAAASLLLFWKTLRIQMIELDKSSKSLRATAKANSEAITQNDKLFKLQVFHRRLSEEFESISNLKKFGLVHYNTDGEIIAKDFMGGATTLNIFNSLTKAKYDSQSKQLIKMLRHESNLKKFDEYTFALLSYSADAIGYIDLGGMHGHIAQQAEELLTFLKPFERLANDIECTPLNQKMKERIKALGAASIRLENSLKTSEEQLCKMILKL